MGLGWKTALTVFFPFVGGYFLIKEHVRTGFRMFGIIWCSLLALVIGESESGSVEGNVVAVLLCLAPIFVYLYQARKTLLASGNTKGRLLIAAFACVLFASIAGCLVNGGVLDWLDQRLEVALDERELHALFVYGSLLVKKLFLDTDGTPDLRDKVKLEYLRIEDKGNRAIELQDEQLHNVGTNAGIAKEKEEEL